MLNQTKTYYCVQHKYEDRNPDIHKLFRTRKLAEQYRITSLNNRELVTVKVNVCVHWK